MPICLFKSALAFLATALLVWGCASARQKSKPEASIRLHLEVPPDRSEKQIIVGVPRVNPYTLAVQREPFLDERYVSNVTSFQAVGGRAIEVTFGTTGARLLEQYSLAQRGRQFAILAAWNVGRSNVQTRWLAAPVFTRTITDGKVRFSPDASEDEIVDFLQCMTNSLEVLRRTKGI